MLLQQRQASRHFKVPRTPWGTWWLKHTILLAPAANVTCTPFTLFTSERTWTLVLFLEPSLLLPAAAVWRNVHTFQVHTLRPSSTRQHKHNSREKKLYWARQEHPPDLQRVSITAEIRLTLLNIFNFLQCFHHLHLLILLPSLQQLIDIRVQTLIDSTLINIQ